MNVLSLAKLLFLCFHVADARRQFNTISVDQLVGISPPTSAELSNVSLRLYTGKTMNDHTTVLVGDAVNLLDQMDPNKPNVFYISGWTESPETLSVVTVISAYLNRGDHNVVVIDWHHIAAQAYPPAAVSVSHVGKTVATAMNDMVKAGLNSLRIHVIGHSLGSQVAGAVGRNLNFSLPRITGLDPAGPGFYVIVKALTSADATFVDVIHTDVGFLGTSSNDGTAKFYPNGGAAVQPGCLDFEDLNSEIFSCSHSRSWMYYAESLLNEDAFIGVSCDSNFAFRIGLCSSNPTAVMGYGTPTTVIGNYYLRTNSESPYGKGVDGTKTKIFGKLKTKRQ